MNRYKALSDSDLIHLLRQDDEQALSAIYYRYWDKMLSVALHRIDDIEDAKEIVQDIFFKLWERREALQLKYTLSTYLAAAVKYRVINLLDHRGRKRVKEAQLPDFTAGLEPSPEQYLLEQELMGQLEASVNRLPEKCRIVFKMSREQSLTTKQIAAELEISERTVEAHIYKALKNIQSDLTIATPAILLVVLEQSKFPF